MNNVRGTREQIAQRYTTAAAELVALVSLHESLQEQYEAANRDGRDDEADALDLRVRDVQHEIEALGPEVEWLGFGLDDSFDE